MAVFPLRCALQTSERKRTVSYCIKYFDDEDDVFGLTIIRVGHLKAIGVFPGQSVNQVDLLHAKLDGVFELGPAVAVGDKELQEKH